MWTRSFWKSTAERALKTFAQALAATLTVTVLTDTDLLWPAVAAAGLAAALSVLTSLGSTAVGDSDTPSLVAEVDPVGDDEPEDDSPFPADEIRQEGV